MTEAQNLADMLEEWLPGSLDAHPGWLAETTENAMTLVAFYNGDPDGNDPLRSVMVRDMPVQGPDLWDAAIIVDMFGDERNAPQGMVGFRGSPRLQHPSMERPGVLCYGADVTGARVLGCIDRDTGVFMIIMLRDDDPEPGGWSSSILSTFNATREKAYDART